MQIGGSLVMGSNGDSLTIAGVTDRDDGEYSCNATDIVSTAMSNTATLTAGKYEDKRMVTNCYKMGSYS